jgi:uncharacterized BrkB/YihY/UPF0761 family membrane protein
VSEAPRTSRLASIKEQTSRARARADQLAVDVPAFNAARHVARHDTRVAGRVLAAAIAYRLFLWMLPLALLLAGVLRLLHDRSPEQPNDVAESLGLSAYVASSVANAASDADQGRWLLLGIGAIGLWSASAAGGKTMFVVHALVWGGAAPASRTAALSVGFLGAAVTAIGLSLLAHQVHGLERQLLARLALLAILAGLSLLASLGLPHDDAPWTALVPGALFVAIGVVAMQVVTAVYLVGRLESSSELYGGLGAAAAILLWLYFLGRLLVGSAVVNAALWERRHPQRVSSGEASTATLAR